MHIFKIKIDFYYKYKTMNHKSNNLKTYNLLLYDINEKIKLKKNLSFICLPNEIISCIFKYVDPLLKLKMSLLCKFLNQSYNNLDISDKIFDLNTNVKNPENHKITSKKFKFNIVVILKHIGYSYKIKNNKFDTFWINNFYDDYILFNPYDNFLNNYKKILSLFETKYKIYRKDYTIKSENKKYIISIQNLKEYDSTIDKIFKKNKLISIYKLVFKIKKKDRKENKQYKYNEIEKYISELRKYKPNKFVLYKIIINNIFIDQIKNYIEKYINNYNYNKDYYDDNEFISYEEEERRYISMGMEHDPLYGWIAI